MADEEVPVLIVGGSLVGLSTSLFLAQHGSHRWWSSVIRAPRSIRARHSSTSGRSSCTAALGIQDEIDRGRPRSEFVQNGAIVSVESLGGEEIDWYFRNINEGVEASEPVAAAVHHPDRARADSAERAPRSSAPDSSTAPSSSRSRPTATA